MWNGQLDVLNAYGSVFGQGDIFSWLIWDSSTDTYYAADAVYDESYPDTEAFAIGGESGITDLVARTLFMQQIDLPAGWGLYSTYISPENGALEDVLAEVVDNLVIEPSVRPDDNTFSVILIFDIVGLDVPTQTFTFLLEPTR